MHNYGHYHLYSPCCNEKEDFTSRRKQYEVRDAHGVSHVIYAERCSLSDAGQINFFDGDDLVASFTLPISVK